MDPTWPHHQPHEHLTPGQIAEELHYLLTPGVDIAAALDALWQCPTCRRRAISVDSALEWLQLDEPLAFHELENGERRYDELMAVGPELRRLLMDGEDTAAAFASWGVACVLLAQIHVVDDLDQARELAGLLIEIATRLDPTDYGWARVSDMIARGYAAVADVERRCGRLSRAEEWVVQARLAARRGTGRATPFLDTVEADLLDALGHHAEAVTLRRPANDVWATLGEVRRRLEARLEAARSEGLIETVRS